MPKEFYTERDIEDMVKRGVMSLRLNDNVVITDLAYEAANRLGMTLQRDKPAGPSAAPVQPAPSSGTPASGTTPPPAGPDLRQRIHSAVLPRLGDQVDAQLLDVIITRVMQSTGIK